MARTTPAQKPRGEHSSTVSGGLWSGAPVIRTSVGRAALDNRPAAVSSLKPIEEAGVGRQVGQYAADRLAHQDNDAGLGERAIARNAHAGGKNLMLGTLSGLEALPAVGDKLAKAAAEPGDRNLALRHEGCEQLRPLSLIAIKAPGLDQLGAGVFVVCIHRALPYSAPVLRRARKRPSRRTGADPVSMRRAFSLRAVRAGGARLVSM